MSQEQDDQSEERNVFFPVLCGSDGRAPRRPGCPHGDVVWSLAPSFPACPQVSGDFGSGLEETREPLREPPVSAVKRRLPSRGSGGDRLPGTPPSSVAVRAHARETCLGSLGPEDTLPDGHGNAGTQMAPPGDMPSYLCHEGFKIQFLILNPLWVCGVTSMFCLRLCVNL